MDERRAVNLLTLAGGIPFVGLTLWTFTDIAYSIRVDVAVVLLMLYAALILSFLGGVRFGMEVRDPVPGAAANLVWSVVPSLLAWFLLAVSYASAMASNMDGIGWGFALFALAFVLQFIWDSASVRAGEMPAWFGAVRRRITLIVVPSLLLAAIRAWAIY